MAPLVTVAPTVTPVPAVKVTTPPLRGTPPLLSSPQPSPISSPRPSPASSPASTIATDVIIQNLSVPWSVAFDPRGRLFFTERAGRVRLWENGTLQPEPVAILPVAAVGEAGLLGLALAPNFQENHFFYVYHTFRNSGGGLSNRVVRLTEQNGRASDPVVILDGIPGANIHDGGRLRFGPDGKLYVTTGDAAAGQLAQDLKSLAGKILRMNPDGSIPPDNPFPDSLVFSLGHRNPQGLDWHPETGVLFAAEHGPSAHDEVNIIKPGGNYGWPNVTGTGGGNTFINPLIETGTDTWAPSGASFYKGNLIPGWKGNFFIATLRGVHLRRLVLKPPAFLEIASSEALFLRSLGRLREVSEGPDGALYITTNNRDGRGSPIPEDDRIIRISLR